MPGYIETVSLEASQADVFNSLYTRADRLISYLDKLRLGNTNDRANQVVTDTGLILVRPTGERASDGVTGEVKIFASPEFAGVDEDKKDNKEVEQSEEETEKVDPASGFRIPLLTQGHLTRVESQQPVTYPTFLGAYRRTEPRPDYKFDLSKSGKEPIIVSKLGKWGVKGALPEPYGSSARTANTKLIALGGDDRERFVLIANTYAQYC